MNPSDLFLFRFLLASGGCLAAGLLVWAVLRRLNGCTLQRSTWLLAQLTIAAAFLVILLPHSERLRVVPPIELETRSSASLATPTVSAAPVAVAPVQTVPARSWLVAAAQAWFVIYLLGFTGSVLGLLHARRLLNGLASAGRPVMTPADTGLEVIEVDAPISPMLFGLSRPRLLLPRHLRSFDALQQQMIVDHELTHLRRRDLHWMSAGLLLQSLLWFNPFMRLLRVQLAWAQELGCDRDVLDGRPAAYRKAYAAALVAQLKTQHQGMNVALAFGGLSASTVAARIALIRAPGRGEGKWGRIAAVGVLAMVFAGSLAFQPALASRVEVVDCTAIADAASGRSLVREGQCGERVTPASTFNIVVSLMGYDSGILIDEHTPSMPFKRGYADWNPSWHATTDPSRWMEHSVVWYAQQVTTQLGTGGFERYVRQFDYGNRDVAGGLTTSWISSSLQISPDEQVAFLRRMVKRELQVSAKAYDLTGRIMLAETLPNGWRVHGKTGTANALLSDGSEDKAHQIGWYVGWATKGERTVVFARLSRLRREGDRGAGPRVKAEFLRALPALL